MSVIRIATFRCLPDKVDLVETVITRFIEAVRGGEPGTRFYMSMRDAADPTSFTALMVFEDEAAEAAHASTEWVRRFTAGLYPNLRGGVTFSDYLPVAGIPGDDWPDGGISFESEA